MAKFKLYNPEPESIALVTGAASGIGRCFALRLAAMGYDLALIDLDGDALDRTAAEIHGVRCRCKVMDLAQMDSAELLAQWCDSEGITPSVLVNNAGVFAYCDMLKLSVGFVEQLLTLHCITLTKMCRYFSERMVASGRGGYILNMASYSQWMPFPGMSLYGSSKSFVKSFSVSFSKEVEQQGVVVTAISPAGVATPLYGLPENLQRLGIKVGALITADSCARRGLRALSRGRRHIVPDWWNRLFAPFCLYMPDFVTRWLRGKTIDLQRVK